MRTIILGFCAFAMTSSIRAELAIEPTAENFAEAVKLLTKDQLAMLKRRFSYRLDASQAVFHEPITEPSKKPLRGYYKIAHNQFVAFLNDTLSETNAPLVRLNVQRIYVASNNDKGREASMFTIKLLVSDASGRTIDAEGFASGPRYNVFKVWNVSKNPVSIRSENIGYFAAFLRAAIKLEELHASDEVGERGPKPDGVRCAGPNSRRRTRSD